MYFVWFFVIGSPFFIQVYKDSDEELKFYLLILTITNFDLMRWYIKFLKSILSSSSQGLRDLGGWIFAFHYE